MTDRSKLKTNHRGFTLVELLVVVVVLAVLAAVVLPKFVGSDVRSKESALKSDIRVLRTAVDAFKADTGVFPKQLEDLASETPPSSGMDTNGAKAEYTLTDWNGPYINLVPKDPITGEDFNYDNNPPTVGRVSSSSNKVSTTGTPYSSW